MDKLTPPEALNLEESNLADTWRRWKQRFEVFSLASGLSEKARKSSGSNPVTRSRHRSFGGLQYLHMGQRR